MSYTYQVNAYFCINYDEEYSDMVFDIVEKCGYNGILGDDATHPIGKCLLVGSSNSDIQSSRGFIFIDEMTFEGEEFAAPDDCYINVEPSEQLKREEKYNDAIIAITKLYEEIVTYFIEKKIKISPSIISVGWSYILCTWESEEAESVSV